MKSHTLKIVAILMTTIFFVFDRFFKVFALNYLGHEYLLIGNFFKFNFTANYYIAFSLPLSGWWLTVLIFIIIICLIYYLVILLQRGQLINAWLIANVVLGASSNLYDRVKYEFVIDYLDLKYFTVFNLADVMIVGGIIGLLLLIYIKVDKNKKEC